MLDFIRSLSPKTEFILVITICFGYSILISVLLLISGLLGIQTVRASFTNSSLLGLILYEITVFLIAFTFLRARDNPLNFHNNMKVWKLISAGLILLIVYYTVYYLLFLGLNNLLPEISTELFTPYITGKLLNPVIVIAVSVINPVFEEMIVVGYIVPALSPRKGILYAVNISILIRFLYHLYQGPVAALSIIPMGLIFTFAFVKWNNIWPLIIAHAILDLIGLSFYL